MHHSSRAKTDRTRGFSSVWSHRQCYVKVEGFCEQGRRGDSNGLPGRTVAAAPTRPACRAQHGPAFSGEVPASRTQGRLPPAPACIRHAHCRARGHSQEGCPAPWPPSSPGQRPGGVCPLGLLSGDRRPAPARRCPARPRHQGPALSPSATCSQAEARVCYPHRRPGTAPCHAAAALWASGCRASLKIQEPWRENLHRGREELESWAREPACDGGGTPRSLGSPSTPPPSSPLLSRGKLSPPHSTSLKETGGHR